ncbi:MAG: hypothetical protein KC418_07170 [Anaerolineales bacterium]|nr:hypothetical protein [Anaerolineales bacterium]MCB8954381.1 hypothetical protein [Ardenticatenales bacterium]
MHQQKKVYNVGIALIFMLLGGIVFGGVYSGQFGVWLDALPVEKLGIFRQPSAENIVYIPLTQESIPLTFAHSGRYRIISEASNVIAGDLHIYDNSTGQETPRVIVDRIKNDPYDTDLLRGNILLDFQIEAPGTYELRFEGRKLPANDPSLVLFPDYTLVNRQRLILLLLLPIFLIVILRGRLWSRLRDSSKSKVEQAAKQNKWEMFTEDDSDS